MTKVAIIGAGNISAAHIRAYRMFNSRCRIAGIVDIDAAQGRSRVDEFRLDVPAYRDADALLKDQRVDLVSLCTPPFTHRDLAVKFLSEGVNVLCEKPMASSLEECDAMLDAQRGSGKILSIVANNRFRTPYVRLKHVLDSGIAGPLVHAQVDSFWWRGLVYYDRWWRGTWEKEGGGCTLNHGVHHIDLLQWMVGMPVSVSATLANLMHPNAEVEDYSTSVLQLADGRVGVVSCSVVHHGESQQVVFQCELAKIAVPWDAYASTSNDTGFPVANEELRRLLDTMYQSVPELVHEGHAGQIENILNVLEHGAPLAVSGIDGRNTLELISAIYQSGSTRTEATLPLPRDAPFYTTAGILQHAVRFGGAASFH